MTTSFKKALLLGTALVAVGASGANAATQTLAGNIEWASTGVPVAGAGDGTAATAGDAAVMAGNNLTVQNDGTNNDGSGLNSFSLGAVTATTGNLVISTSTTSVYDADLSVTAASIAISGVGDISILSEDTDNSSVTVSVTAGMSNLGDLLLTNNETTTADDISLTVGGNASVALTTGITAGAFAGATSSVTLNGAINALTGAVTVTGGAGTGSDATLTLNGTTSNTLGATLALINAKSKVYVNENTTVTTSITNDAGTVYVAAGKVLTNASFLGTSGIYDLAVSDANGTLAATDFGRLASAGAINLGAEKIAFNVTGRLGAATTGTLVGTVFDGGAAAVTTATVADVTDNSALYDFDLVTNTNEFDIRVTKTTADVATITTTTNNDVVAYLMDNDSAITTTVTGNLLAVRNSVLSSSSAAVMDERAEATLPSVDAGAADTVVDVAAQSVGVTDTRLASIRSGDDTGAVAGQMSNGMEVWLQGFGKLAQQDKRGDVDGFDADTYGAAVGIDTADVMDDATLGLAVSYAMTDVESDNANTTETDIDSYQVSLYGEHDLGDGAFVNGTLGYGHNSIDQTRHAVGGVSGLNADADYDSNQYIATVGVGRTLALASGMTLTPTTGVNFQHVSIDDYTETGAGTANMTVETDSINILELGVGAEVAFDAIDMDGSTLTPAMDFGYRYDVIGDAVEASSTFNGGGAAFKTTGADPQQGKFNIGASLAYAMDSSASVKVSYDYEMKGEDYAAHSGFVRAGYKF